MKWIKCTDRLPRIDEKVLGWDGENIEKGFIDRYEDGKPFWTFYDYLEWHDVTHWGELPEPPAVFIEDEV